MRDETRFVMGFMTVAALTVVGIALVLALTGCATAPAPEILDRVVERRVVVPPSYFMCREDPVSPGGRASPGEAARYIVDLAHTNADLRRCLGAVRRIVGSDGP